MAAMESGKKENAANQTGNVVNKQAPVSELDVQGVIADYVSQ